MTNKGQKSRKNVVSAKATVPKFQAPLSGKYVVRSGKPGKACLARSLPGSISPISPEAIRESASVLRERFGEMGVVRKLMGLQRELLHAESIRNVSFLAHQAAKACLQASITGSERETRKLVSSVRGIVGHMKQYPDSAVLQDTAQRYLLRLLTFIPTKSPTTNAIYPVRTLGVIPIVVRSMRLYSCSYGIMSTGLELLRLLCTQSDLEDRTQCRRAVHELDGAGGLDAVAAGLAYSKTRCAAVNVLKQMVVFASHENVLKRMQAGLGSFLEHLERHDSTDTDTKKALWDDLHSLKERTDAHLHWLRWRE